MSIPTGTRESLLQALHGVASRLPGLESPEQRTCIRQTERAKSERRTGARFLSRSSAVRDDGPIERSQASGGALHRFERDGYRTRNVASGVALGVSHVHDRDSCCGYELHID